MNKPPSNKERNLLKGAIRRVFSRSELRRKVVDSVKLEHCDASRPRVKKWGYCEACGEVVASYTLQVDHKNPIIPIGKTLSDLTWDEIVDNLWVDEANLQALCERCHKHKSKLEQQQRKLLKRNK